MQDQRISLIAEDPGKIELYNQRLKRWEAFLVHGEAGRGGSCIVYRAFACDPKGVDRPVLLKEWYPAACAKVLDRRADTGEISLREDAPESVRQRCLKEQELFAQSCTAPCPSARVLTPCNRIRLGGLAPFYR